MALQPLIARRKRELDLKLASLEDELSRWNERTKTAPMRRHRSQIVRLTRTLAALLDRMKASDGWKTPTDEMVLANAAAWEKRILTAHAIWEVFRSKLLQRNEELFGERLLAYDDLAWACYEPAMTHYAAAANPQGSVAKEPPLVYLNSTWSAFLRRRDSAFDMEVQEGKDTAFAVDDADYRATLQKLPVPLLALPWFQVAHPPSALMIAHEVGHAVEFDFNLTAGIDQALRGANLQFETQWRGCASEVFADLYGCACVGRYYAGALLDLLVADRQFVAGEYRFGEYPTRHYRAALVVAALASLGGAQDAEDVRKTWEAVYGQTQELVEYQADVDKVVAAIYGPTGMNLAAFIVPPSANVVALAQYAVQGNKIEVAKHTDARVLFSALRHVYEHRSAADLNRAQALLLQQVVQGYAGTFRYRTQALTTAPELDASLDATVAADQAAARALETLLDLGED
jgi:hypothetical protein